MDRTASRGRVRIVDVGAAEVVLDWQTFPAQRAQVRRCHRMGVDGDVTIWVVRVDDVVVERTYLVLEPKLAADVLARRILQNCDGLDDGRQGTPTHGRATAVVVGDVALRATFRCDDVVVARVVGLVVGPQPNRFQHQRVAVVDAFDFRERLAADRVDELLVLRFGEDAPCRRLHVRRPTHVLAVRDDVHHAHAEAYVLEPILLRTEGREHAGRAAGFGLVMLTQRDGDLVRTVIPAFGLLADGLRNLVV